LESKKKKKKKRASFLIVLWGNWMENPGSGIVLHVLTIDPKGI